MKAMKAGIIDPDGIDSCLNDDDWWVQQKLDGDRVLFRVEDGKATALNKQGEIRVNLVPRVLFAQFERMPGSWVFDGELMDDGTYWLFDMPLARDLMKPTDPYRHRLVVLERFFAGWSPASCVRLLPTARTTETKVALIESTLANGGEGVIFKHAPAPYRAGKESRAVLKLKFWNSAECVVTAVSPEGRDNCLVSLFEGGRLIEPTSVGTSGKPTVHVGDVVEIRYLYATDARQLYQPSLLRVREDKAPSECTVDQLVFTNREVVEFVEPRLGLVRQRRRSRSCGVPVEIHDTWHPQSFLAPQEERWAALCVAHGAASSYPTLKAARTVAATPNLWCPSCAQGAATARKVLSEP